MEGGAEAGVDRAVLHILTVLRVPSDLLAKPVGGGGGPFCLFSIFRRFLTHLYFNGCAVHPWSRKAVNADD